MPAPSSFTGNTVSLREMDTASDHNPLRARFNFKRNFFPITYEAKCKTSYIPMDKANNFPILKMNNFYRASIKLFWFELPLNLCITEK